MDDHSRFYRTKIPRQVVAPPGVKPATPLKENSNKHSTIKMNVHKSEDYEIPREIVVVGVVGVAGGAEVAMEEEEDMEASSVNSRKKTHYWGKTSRSRPELRHQ